jgi:hypothetical protein
MTRVPCSWEGKDNPCLTAFLCLCFLPLPFPAGLESARLPATSACVPVLTPLLTAALPGCLLVLPAVAVGLCAGLSFELPFEWAPEHGSLSSVAAQADALAVELSYRHAWLRSYFLFACMVHLLRLLSLVLNLELLIPGIVGNTFHAHRTSPDPSWTPTPGYRHCLHLVSARHIGCHAVDGEVW